MMAAPTARPTRLNQRMPQGIELRVLRLKHSGKGWAVRSGIQESHGDLVMFADTGSCVPYENVLPALDKLRQGECDIANGSRKMRGSVITYPQALHRRLFSRMFRWLVGLYLGLPRHLTDTQCGFKAYNGEVARELYGECVTDGFLFDLEVLMRARDKGHTVAEFPVHWTCNRDSRLKSSHELFKTLPALRALKKRLAQEQPVPAVVGSE